MVPVFRIFSLLWKEHLLSHLICLANRWFHFSGDIIPFSKRRLGQDPTNIKVVWNKFSDDLFPICNYHLFWLQRKWSDLNHSPSTSGELLSRVTECFYSGGDLTVNELMKQIDDYMDYYNWERCRVWNWKSWVLLHTEPSLCGAPEEVFMSVQDGGSSTRIRIFRRPLLHINQRSAGN